MASVRSSCTPCSIAWGWTRGPLNLEAGISSVNREEWLDEGRVDLVVRAPGWVLAVENKIYHWAANNFISYAESIRKVAGRPVHLAHACP